ncbi:hypothetical protein HPP92_006434 [Vanilla planifolia]|uniref:Eukaryotic translation initiation factor 3 subunit E n=1 Tax=Vanilla planifolia TaxID=51239 RepID=A0A835RIC3_VANPL|nr:hypothetical protein HPP92_006434 [Vanilla planifolia]
MAMHDLTSSIAPHLDRHLVFPLLEFLQERQLYADDEILKAKIDLLSQMNMVDYAMDIHKTLYRTEEVPKEMMDRRAEVVGRLKSLEEAAAPLLSFLLNAALVQELRPDKQYNLQMLNDRFQIGPEQIEALYQYAKFQFECGNYSDAAVYLYQYRALCTNSDRSLSALWGKLAAEILMQNWDVALEELNRLKEIIDSKNFASPLYQLQNRIWLMHWSLFIFFNHENGRNGIIDLFFQDRYLNAIQTNANHLVRYLATAVIVNKRRRNMLKELIKVIQQESHAYKDPITEFLECFMLAEKLNMKYDEAEGWIMNLIQNAKLDARIDSMSRTVVMKTSSASAHEQLIESMKNLNTRLRGLSCCILHQIGPSFPTKNGIQETGLAAWTGTCSTVSVKSVSFQMGD